MDTNDLDRIATGLEVANHLALARATYELEQDQDAALANQGKSRAATIQADYGRTLRKLAAAMNGGDHQPTDVTANVLAMMKRGAE